MAGTSKPIPIGTVALLFTDIEGSTRRWEDATRSMSEAVVRHDELMRDAIESNDGYVFKTMGDAFYAAFSTPAQAVAAAIGAQRTLAAADFATVDGLRVRMAIHTGLVESRDRDYFGPTVNRVARLLSIVHGGQMVASGPTAELLRDSLPAGLLLRDAGMHRLKDLADPEHVYQVVAPDLDQTFPPLQSLQSMPNNLPQQTTSFVGREAEIAEIEALVREHRLVTLLGPGGIGKTRIALQCAADLLDGSGDGVWMVELAVVADPSQVPGVIAAALGVRERPERPVFETLVEYLKKRRLLIVLDNCEHVVAEVARIADAMLRTCPDVHLLTTSREGIAIAGEHIYRLPSLPIPSAVELFVTRARAADSRFELTGESSREIATICERLDGIALAIELAAARVKVLSVKNIGQRLDERFRVLTGGSRTALPRQQTLRALIDWSYDLLSERERTLFRRLGVFSGGWTISAAESVASDERLDVLDILDDMSSLVDKSLVVPEIGEEDARYRLLESMRAYASDKLDECEEREHFVRSHAIWVAELAQRADEEYSTLPFVQWYARYSPEVDNVRAALTWALGASGDMGLAGSIAAQSYGLWREAGLSRDGLKWVDAVLERADQSAAPAIVGRLWLARAFLSVAKDGIDSAQRAIAIFESLGMRLETARVYNGLVFFFMQANRLDEALQASDRAIEIYRDLRVDAGQRFASALNARANILDYLGRLDEARDLFNESIGLFSSLGDDARTVSPRLNLAELEFHSGDAPRALALAGLAAELARESNDRRFEAAALSNIAAYQIVLGAFVDAEEAAREALSLAQGLQWVEVSIWAIEHLATAAALHGEFQNSGRIRGFTDRWYRDAGIERGPTEQKTYELLDRALTASLSEAEIAALSEEGGRWTVDQAIESACR